MLGKPIGEDERIAAYVPAYHATRNTSMHWVVEHIFRDLYGLEITDEASVRAADEAVRAAAGQIDWPQQVCRRAAIRRIVVNDAKDVEFHGLPQTSCFVPRVEERIGAWLARLAAAPDVAAAGRIGEEVDEEISSLLAKTREVAANGQFERFKTSSDFDGTAQHPEWMA